MRYHFFLQEIFRTQGLNLSLPHCRQTLYRLSHQGSLECPVLMLYSNMLLFSTFNVWHFFEGEGDPEETRLPQLSSITLWYKFFWEGLRFLHSFRVRSTVTSWKITDTWDLAAICSTAIVSSQHLSSVKEQSLQNADLPQASGVPQARSSWTAPAGRNLRAGLQPDAPNLRPGWKLLTPVAKLSAPLLMFLKMDDLSLKKKN